METHPKAACTGRVAARKVALIASSDEVQTAPMDGALEPSGVHLKADRLKSLFCFLCFPFLASTFAAALLLALWGECEASSIGICNANAVSLNRSG